MIIDCHFHLDERLMPVDAILRKMDDAGIDRVALMAPLVDPFVEPPPFLISVLQFLLFHRPLRWAGKAAVSNFTKNGEIKILGRPCPIYAELDNASILAGELKGHGLRLVSGGTDNHLVLVDLTETGVTGKQALEALEATGIVTNMNVIPFDTRPPAITSGIRLGTPAVTTRGFGKEEIKSLADLIVRVVGSPDDEKVRDQVRRQVLEICDRFPVPGIDD